MADSALQLVLVTPETTLVDAPVRSLQFPLYDGQIGVLPGRAPVVGRLGYGVLTVTAPDGEVEKFFIEGGFVQVKAGTVTLLTDRARGVEDIDRETAEELLAEASKRVPVTDAELAAKERDQESARRMLAVGR
ncbi:MAG: ATP synthase F1 subunit epsilon [Planctomycetaceae bacterium]|nr:ATP synthase F1 subunit epsilon [Planctomycetaceae bacterium]